MINQSNQSGQSIQSIQEPTAEQCENRSRWIDEDGFEYIAFWWPQMGGYCAKALARTLRCEDSIDGDCVKVWIWHDGEFPFSEGDRDFDDKSKSPAVLHICDFSDWQEKMNMLAEFQYERVVK